MKISELLQEAQARLWNGFSVIKYDENNFICLALKDIAKEYLGSRDLANPTILFLEKLGMGMDGGGFRNVDAGESLEVAQNNRFDWLTLCIEVAKDRRI